MRRVTEKQPLDASRARLTRRAVVWAADALADDGTTVSALARRLHVDWRTERAAAGVAQRREAPRWRDASRPRRCYFGW